MKSIFLRILAYNNFISVNDNHASDTLRMFKDTCIIYASQLIVFSFHKRIPKERATSHYCRSRTSDYILLEYDQTFRLTLHPSRLILH